MNQTNESGQGTVRRKEYQARRLSEADIYQMAQLYPDPARAAEALRKGLFERPLGENGRIGEAEWHQPTLDW